MEQAWYQKNYRRNLVDMHIEDWDESFLSEFDPEEYVRMLKRANVTCAMVYANSHVGLCLSLIHIYMCIRDSCSTPRLRGCRRFGILTSRSAKNIG